MGKWSHLKGALEAYKEDPTRQQKIDEEKAKILEELGPAPKTGEVGKFYDKLRVAMDAVDESKKKLQLKIDAAEQMLLSLLDEQGLSLCRLEGGTSLFMKDEPYSSVQDKPTFIAWIKETKQEDLLSVHYQTMNSLVKDALSGGQPIPPGIRVFIKTTLNRRRKG